jgi:hypothetical protein
MALRERLLGIAALRLPLLRLRLLLRFVPPRPACAARSAGSGWSGPWSAGSAWSSGGQVSAPERVETAGGARTLAPARQVGQFG